MLRSTQTCSEIPMSDIDWAMIGDDPLIIEILLIFADSADTFSCVISFYREV